MAVAGSEGAATGLGTVAAPVSSVAVTDGRFLDVSVADVVSFSPFTSHSYLKPLIPSKSTLTTPALPITKEFQAEETLERKCVVSSCKAELYS
jgi:hypothetical protein